ncbi:MAG: sensor histidine kinase [Caulobacter sp.]|nr:sensor histidine kinase [Caulobacter sp.]
MIRTSSHARELRDGTWRSAVGGRRAGGPCGGCSLQVEADHRIANHLALLAGYVRLQAAHLAKQSAEPTRESVRLLIATIDAQITTVARLHRSLATHGRPVSTDLGEHLHEVCAPFVAGLSGGTRLVEDFKAGCVVRPEHVQPLTQIVAEVVTNAIKHAQTAGGPGDITVSCVRDMAGDLLVEVTDTGPGLPATFDPAIDGGLGFRLLRALGKQVGATITFDSSRQGTHFQLALPAAQPDRLAPTGRALA